MRRAVSDFRVSGVRTNLPFHRWLLDHEAFAAGSYDTGFMPAFWNGRAVRPKELEDVAAVVAALAAARPSGAASPSRGGPAGVSAWRSAFLPGGAGRQG
jgi:acetyl/propionyl-CoA carboxylase alpha subunit